MAKSKIDPASIRRILATDCGSTTTKAILIQKVDGEYRQTHRGEAPRQWKLLWKMLPMESEIRFVSLRSLVA